jgi:hypothetical protein
MTHTHTENTTAEKRRPLSATTHIPAPRGIHGKHDDLRKKIFSLSFSLLLSFTDTVRHNILPSQKGEERALGLRTRPRRRRPREQLRSNNTR